MSRLEFMKELARLLEDLPREEKIEILKYYNGYFDDAGEENEAAIIEELGSPAKVAASVKAGMDETTAEHMEFTEKGVSQSYYYEESPDRLHEKRREQHTDREHPAREGRNGWKAIAIVLLILVTFPVWIGLAGGLIGLVAGLFGVVIGLGGAVVGCLVGFLVGGIASIAGGFAKLLFSPLGGMMSIAVGILLLGVAVLCFLLCGLVFGKLIPLIFKGIGNLFRFIGKVFQGREERMKTWKKITLIVGVVLVLIGGIMTLICVALGATWKDANVTPDTFRLLRHEQKIPGESKDTSENTDSWTFDKEEVDSLRIDVKAGEVYIKEGAEYSVEIRNSRGNFQCEVRDGLLALDEDGKTTGWSIFDWNVDEYGISTNHPIITVTVPSDMVFEIADISVGAGSIRADRLAAEKMSVSVDAGSVTIESGSSLETLEVDVDAGAAIFKDFQGKEAVFAVDVGAIEYQGTLQGDWEADCDLGSIELALQGSEKDHNYAVDNDLGTINIGKQRFSGNNKDHQIQNGAKYDADLNCDMGSIDIIFEK